jgi:hypothetical protein
VVANALLFPNTRGERGIPMSERSEGTVEIVAALLIMFSAMLDPRVSVTLAILFLSALAMYKLNPSRGKQ